MDPEVAEEQAMEMEALQAIYMEDIEGGLVCLTPPGLKFLS